MLELDRDQSCRPNLKYVSEASVHVGEKLDANIISRMVCCDARSKILVSSLSVDDSYRDISMRPSVWFALRTTASLPEFEFKPIIDEPSAITPMIARSDMALPTPFGASSTNPAFPASTFWNLGMKEGKSP